ncbi:MAG: pilus assembly protein [Shimia sp.]
MLNQFKTFRADEVGAVTVDWVVLTAAIVGLGIAVLTTVSGGVQDLAGDIDTQLKKDGILTHTKPAS